MRAMLVARLREVVPLERRLAIKRLKRRISRPAWLGTLRNTTPLSTVWGHDRGIPLDRYYIEQFLEENRCDVKGHALEVKDSFYTHRYDSGVVSHDVLDISPANPLATIVADLAKAEMIPSSSFDCFILTQTLQYVYDLRSAINHIHRILRPNGVLLVTVPVISRMDSDLVDYWRFTPIGCQALLSEIFGQAQVTSKSYGNVLTAIASLSGMAYEELSRSELDAFDKNFPVIVGIRAVKKG